MSSEFVLSGPRGFTDTDKRTFVRVIFDSLMKNANRTAFINVLTGEAMTYEDVLKKSLALMTAFRKLGIRRGDIICFLAENHINYFIPFIAALFSGITTHLINPQFLNYELNNSIQISKPKLIISSNCTLEKAFYLRSKYDFVEMIINLDSCGQEDIFQMNNLIHLHESQTMSEELGGFDDVNEDAIIINSSGTTGLPKGVLLTHLNLKCIINYSQDKQYFAVTNDDTLLLYLPNFHMFGVLLFVSVIVAGGKGIVFPKFRLTELMKSIEKYRVQKLFVVPPIVVLLTKTKQVPGYDLRTLKHVFCGAAPLGPEVEKRFETRFGFKIRQLYGLSELTGIVTICKPSTPIASSVGKLIPGCFAKVLDVNTNTPLPPFIAGELCFKGAMVMKGYHENPKASEDSLDADGFLHTGDLGYYDENGNFYIADRLKDIIKYKAWQVAPAEIEDLLKSHTDIKDAGVIGIPDELAGEVAMALVVKEPNSAITDVEIIQFVAENTSVPKQLHGGVVFVDAIPKNPSGKILRKLLRKLSGIHTHSENK